MHKVLALLLLIFTFLFSSQMGIVHSLDPNGDGFLSLRSKPKGRELGRLYTGDKVTILDKRGKWYKVKTADGQVGYSHSNWIRKVNKSDDSNIQIINSRHPVHEAEGLYIVDFELNNKKKTYRVYCPTSMVRDITNDSWGKAKKVSGKITYVVDKVCSGSVDRIATNSQDDSIPSWCNASRLNKTEHTICADDNLSALDMKLAKVYGSSKASSKDIEQRVWLKKRNQCGNDISCIKKEYEDRIEVLKSITEYVQDDSRIKWIDPSGDICRSKGGKLNKKGICEAPWSEAYDICKASGARLPTIDELKEVVIACGSNVSRAVDSGLEDKNKTTSLIYQACYKRKGFSTNSYYWSSDTNILFTNSVQVLIFFRNGLTNEYEKSSIYAVRCKRD